MKKVTGANHITLAVRNLEKSVAFYFLDPDYDKLELHVGTLETRLAAM